MNPQILLAIDGGNSKTDVVLCTEHGKLLAHVHGAGSSPHVLGVDGCLRLLDTLVRDAWAQAGWPSVKVDRAEVYLAGADLPAEVVALHDAVDAAGWASETVVGNDAFALLRAGTDSADAVAVVCGAGINAVGQASDGGAATFPSLGQITGDWGGGRHLGYEALWHAARGEDGRGEPTSLQQIIPAHFGVDSVAAVGEAMHFGAVAESRVTELVPALFRVAQAGDAVARGIVDRLVEEIVSLVRVALRRLGLLDLAVPVVLGGGVVRGQHRMLVPAVQERLVSYAPLAQLCVVTAPPVLGAALYGLDAFGSAESARERIGQALETATASVGQQLELAHHSD